MKYVLSLLSLVAIVITGCENDTQTGALAGAGVGALGGGLIAGNATGAVVGGAVGAAGGALIGAAVDDHDRANMEQNSPQTLHKIDHSEPLSTNDVIEMSKNGLSDNVMISQIQSTKSVFHLSTSDILELKNAGVSQRVIDYMIQTGNQ